MDPQERRSFVRTRRPANDPRLPLSACPYCGNNPVSHAARRLSGILGMALAPVEWMGTRWLGRAVDRWLGNFYALTVRCGKMLRIVTFNDDPRGVPSDRSGVIWEEARRRGIPMRQIIVLGRRLDSYEARLGNRTIVFDSLPIPTHRPYTSLLWLDDKLRLKERLRAAGIPVPQGGAFFRFRPMLEMFRTLRTPVIVKPALGSRGRHTTTFIFTEEQLQHAFAVGKQLSHRLVMEEHLIGSVYRATLVNGKLIGVLRGDPPRVTGDGIRTIRALIEAKNRDRHPRVREVTITPLTEQFLARGGHTPQTVLPRGSTIDLTEKVGITYGGHSAEELQICHPDIKRILENAGSIVDYPVLGFDFIIGDITTDPRTQKWGIIECNSLPFIDLHHHPIEGTPINAAGAVWDLWEVTASGNE